MSRRESASTNRRRRLGYAWFVFPGTAGLLFFYAVPFVRIIRYSLTDNNMSGNFSGISNFLKVLGNTAFRLAIKNTAILAIAGMFFSVSFGLITAMILNRMVKGAASMASAVLILPFALPSACTALLIQCFAPGFRSLKLFGILLLFLWKYTGYSSILLLAALQKVSKTLVDAAKLDGAGKVRIFHMITLRSISPSLFFAALMAFMNSFRMFREVYLLYGDHPVPSAYLISHYINNELRAIDYAKMSAASLIVTCGILAISLGLIVVEKQLGKELEA